MYYFLGERNCYDPAFYFSKKIVDPNPLEADIFQWKRAYAKSLHQYQPEYPAQTELGTKLVTDPALQDNLISGFYKYSSLDDRPHYRDETYFDTSDEDFQITLDSLENIGNRITRFSKFDEGFWAAFRFYVTYIMCPPSRFSHGGTDSSVMGVIFVSEPKRYDDPDLYELLVHEYTHTVMFVDQLLSPHYRNFETLSNPDNFPIACISGRRRPIDKTLHSLIVGIEILLHRCNKLSHSARTVVHPESMDLKNNAIRTIDSIIYHPNRDAILAERGLELVEKSIETLNQL